MTYTPTFFQQPVTPVMEGIINLHDYIFFYLVIILIFTLTIYISIIKDFFLAPNTIFAYRWNSRIWEGAFQFRNFTHETTLEIIWTVIPSIVLFLIAVPSFAMLYSMDEVLYPYLTFKAIGHQWYWSYEISDYGHSIDRGNGLTEYEPYTISIDSNMTIKEDLINSQLRLLETDNSIILPDNVHIRGLITSMDVLHSWAVPAFGVKLDAVPGRLNQVGIYINRTGNFYGQCSELCGVNHGFMPISVKVISIDEYLTWIKDKLSI